LQSHFSQKTVDRAERQKHFEIKISQIFWGGYPTLYSPPLSASYLLRSPYQRVPSRQVPICSFRHGCCRMYRVKK